MPNLLILLPFLLSLACSVFAQTNKGFNYLEEKNWEKSWLAFSKDTADETTGAAAYFGLAKICEKFANKSLDTAEMGLDFKNKSEQLFFNGTEEAIKFAKKYKITQSTYTYYSKRLAALAWKGVEKNGSFENHQKFKRIFPEFYENYTQELESAAWSKVKQSKSFEELEKFREEYPGFFERNDTEEVRAVRREIVRNTYEKTNDYQTLHRLALYHQDYLYNDNITMESDWDRRLWSAFKKTVGIENLAQFIEEHPEHWVNFDCRAKECAVALKEKSLKSLVRFLEDYPDSYLGYSTVSWYIYQTLASDKKAVEALNEPERRRFEEIIATCRMDNYLSNTQKLPADTAALIALIRKGAPSWRAYFLLDKALDNYIREKEFDIAGQLIAICKPFFPNFEDRCSYFYFTRQDWLNSVENILNAPYEALRPRPITELNTLGNEVLPFVSPDRTKLYFTGEGRPDGLRREDPYEVPFTDSTFGKPTLIKGLAGDRNESLLSVTADGQEALVFIDGVIHLSKMTPKGWSKPEELPDIRKDFPWVGKASLTADGNAMIFEALRSRAMAGQSPDMNLYVSLRDTSGNWQKPFPLPKNINTRFRERSPYIHVDGETLYFSSNGHLGLGGMDIFKTKRLDNSWKLWEDPVNLGKEINTIANDWGFNFSVTADGRTAFFSQEDPYKVRKGELMIAGLPKPIRPKAMVILPIPVKSTEGSTIVMKNRNGEVLKTVKVQPGDNRITFMVSEDQGFVSIEAEGDDVIAQPIEVDLTKPAASEVKNLTVLIFKELVEDTTAFQIPFVRFDRSESVLRPDALLALNKFHRALNGKQLRFTITGHTDNVGIEALNQKLSEDRAQSVKNYLVNLGYPATLIDVKGKGWSEPKVENTSEENRSINRRVEFKFIKGSKR